MVALRYMAAGGKHKLWTRSSSGECSSGRYAVVKKWIIALCVIGAAVLFAKGRKPYYITSSVSIDSGGGDYSYAGLNVEVYNKGSKTITSFVLTFSLYDADGLPLFDENYKTIEVECNIPPGESIEKCISLDDYIDETSSMEGKDEDDAWGDPYGVDVIFVESITYDDGSVWKDEG